MSPAARRAFLAHWGVGIGALMLAYALVTGIRSVRDLYSKQVPRSVDFETGATVCATTCCLKRPLPDAVGRRGSNDAVGHRGSNDC